MTSPLDDARALAAAPAPAAPPSAPPSTSGLRDLADWLLAHPGADEDRGGARLRRPILALYCSSALDAGDDAAEAAGAAMAALSGGAEPVSVLARAQGAGVELFDLALARPAPDGARLPVMSERECAATLAFGMEALAKTPDLLGLGDAAPGSARRAARLGCALAGDDPALWGEGDPDRAAAVARGRAAAAGDPLQLLRQLGGREVAAIAGALLAARVQATPVLLDGEAALAAAAVVAALNPQALAHVRAAARPASAAGVRLLARLGLDPVLGLGFAHPRGAAAAAAMGVVRLAAELNAGAG